LSVTTRAGSISTALELDEDHIDINIPAMLNDDRLPDTAIEAVMGAFFTRIKTLKAKYKKSLLQESQRRDIEQQDRCYRRKYLVCTVQGLVFLC
jgi:hypothetical protein